MNELAASPVARRVRVNAPVKRFDLRAPAAVLAGTAVAAGIAALIRARPGPSRDRLEDHQALGPEPPPFPVGMSEASHQQSPSARSAPSPLLASGVTLLTIAVPLVGLVAVASGRLPARRMASVRSGAARLLRSSGGLLGLAVLTDSALEHYRGNFRNPAMFAPLVSSTLSILANGQALTLGENHLRSARQGVHLVAGTVGLAGLGFHAYNIGKRPGGYSWLNFFYAAPFGAPAALSLAGLIGYSAERLSTAGSDPRLLGLPFGRAMAGVTSVGLAGTVAEVALLHFRGAYHNPFMWLPVSLPPAAAGLMAKAALAPGGAQAITRGWLWATAVLGVGGVGFHAYGVSRNMGGWRNWTQNLLAGPPLPAPPSFSALALAGIASLNLIGARRGR